MNFLLETLQNVFDPTPPTFSNYAILFIVLSIVFVAGGIALKFYIKANKADKAFKRAFRDFPFRLIVQGVLLGLYEFMRHSAVAFMSMRVLMLAILIAMIYTGYKMYIAYTQTYPQYKKHAEESLEKNKYSTKKRKK
jgi:phosphoglycerol transferase MdoB-like AlkP superfamily enzyme